MVATIIHVHPDPFVKRITINRGGQDHVIAGSAVVDSLGVIGQITQVYQHTSEVTLITDSSLAIPVQIERNGLRAIAFGYGASNTLHLPYLSTGVDIKQGDKLVTSGIDSVYPAGLSVAWVKQVNRLAESPFAQIVCTPIGNVSNYKHVILINTDQN